MHEIYIGEDTPEARSLEPEGDAALEEVGRRLADRPEKRRGEITYADIGGLGSAVAEIREVVELPLKHPELFERLAIDPPRGVLLHGPAGTGKTLLVRALASGSKSRLFTIAGPEIIGRHYGESEERLRHLFAEAADSAPSVIFIDEIDSIAPKRQQVSGELERRVVAQLLTLMDGIEPRKNVVVIGATNRSDAIDEALRRPGRFDREIVIGIPDLDGRREILAIHTRGMPVSDDVDLDEIARSTYGFVGADLAALVRESAMTALRQFLGGDERQAPLPALDALEVRRSDFLDTLKGMKPSLLREVRIETPRTRWSDVGGLGEVQRRLREAVELPLRRPDAFGRLGIRPAKGVLLFGPPGTGKTLLAKAVAR